jgi:hypothetical protein
LSVRVIFAVYLATIIAGLVYFVVVGMLHT